MDKHAFKLTFFKKFTWCQYCGEFIWGVIGKQGYRCGSCKFACHKKCLSQASQTVCPKTPLPKGSRRLAVATASASASPSSSSSSGAPSSIVTSAGVVTISKGSASSTSPTTPTKPPPSKQSGGIVGVRGRSAFSTSASPSPVPGAAGHNPAEELFQVYALGAERIEPDGVEKLCQDLGVETDSLTALVLAWKFGAKETGFFTKQEFVNGMKELRATSLDELRHALSSQQSALDNPTQLRLAYVFAFDFCKESPDKKVVETAYAVPMINLILGGRPNFRHVAKFLQFLQGHDKVKSLNKDQWACLFDFARTVSEDLSNYDDSASWPVLFDEFVSFAKSHK